MKIDDLLIMAKEMDERIWYTEWLITATHAKYSRRTRLEKSLDTRKRASRRLWSAYIKELTKIKLEI